VETEHADLPINFGVSAAPVVMFQKRPAFQPLPGFHGAVLARYPKETDPLESGLLLHPEAIEGKAAADGTSLRQRPYRALSASRPQFRGQSHATYKYLFNELYATIIRRWPSEPAAAPAKAENSVTGDNRPKDRKAGRHVT